MTCAHSASTRAKKRQESRISNALVLCSRGKVSISPTMVSLKSVTRCPSRVRQEHPTRVPPQECPHKSVLQVTHKSVLQECPPRVSCKSVLQKCRARVPTRDKILSECPTRVFCKSATRVSSKSDPQSCKSVPEECSTRESHLDICSFSTVLHSVSWVPSCFLQSKDQLN